MDVLVDYYNVSQQHRSKGIAHVVDRIVSAIVPGHVNAGERHVELRLYGGWYEDRTPTRDAQAISATLREHYPMAISGEPDRRLIVNVQLAYSMKCDPSHHLWHTLRSKTAPRGMKFVDPSSAGCRLADRCPLRPGYDFFVRGRCPEQDCRVTGPLVLRRREQKLVDAMLAADVFFDIFSNEQQIAVVSSDDDLWPVIRTALQFGIGVVHIHTKKGYETKPDYVRGESAGYVQVNLLEGAG